MIRFKLQNRLTAVLADQFRLQGGLPRINEAIERAEDAISSCRDDGLRLWYHSTLALALQYRYQATGALPDLDRAITLLKETEGAPGRPSSVKGASWSRKLGLLYRLRYSRTHDRQDLDAAVRLLPADVDLETSQPASLTNLGNALPERYDSAGDDEDLRTGLRMQEEAVRGTEAGDWQLASRHNNLGNALQRAGQVWGNRAFIRAAADSCRAALALTAPEAQERASREVNLAHVLAALACGKRRGRLVRDGVTAYRAAIRDGLTGSLEYAHGCDSLTGNNHRMVGSNQPPRAAWPRG